MSEWKDTPEGDRVMAELLDGRRVRYRDVKPGDVFRAVAPNGRYVEPGPPFEETDQLYLVLDHPRQLDGTETDQDYGWGMAIKPVEPVDLPKVLN